MMSGKAWAARGRSRGEPLNTKISFAKANEAYRRFVAKHNSTMIRHRPAHNQKRIGYA